jgi:hypothetical protein
MIYEQGGVGHELNNPDDIAKLAGFKPKTIVMVDETGEIIGVGGSVAKVMRSEPLIKALKSGQLSIRKAPRNQPLRKNFGRATIFDGILRELTRMHREAGLS